VGSLLQLLFGVGLQITVTKFLQSLVIVSVVFDHIFALLLVFDLKIIIQIMKFKRERLSFRT
jgi:membrane protein YdbS with pleckstrin-like domain